MDDCGLSFSDIQEVSKIKKDLQSAQEDNRKLSFEIDTVKENEENEDNDEIKSKNIELIEANGKITFLTEEMKELNDQIDK